MKIAKIFIPYYMIETGEARRLFKTHETERSVFGRYCAEWVYFNRDRCGWCRFIRENRNTNGDKRSKNNRH